MSIVFRKSKLSGKRLFALRRNTRSGHLGGVCSGLADFLDTDRTLVRIGALVCGLLLPKVTLIAYGVAWLVLDESAKR